MSGCCGSGKASAGCSSVGRRYDGSFVLAFLDEQPGCSFRSFELLGVCLRLLRFFHPSSHKRRSRSKFERIGLAFTQRHSQDGSHFLSAGGGFFVNTHLIDRSSNHKHSSLPNLQLLMYLGASSLCMYILIYDQQPLNTMYLAKYLVTQDHHASACLAVCFQVQQLRSHTFLFVRLILYVKSMVDE